MTLSRRELINIKKSWENTQNAQECPICKKKIKINIDFEKLQKFIGNCKGIYPHLILHGDPLHGMIYYIDTHMAVRSVDAIESVEILEDPETLKQLMIKWKKSYLNDN